MVGDALGHWASENIIILVVIAAFFGTWSHSEIIRDNIGRKAWYVYLVATFSVGCLVIGFVWFVL
jgi:hypothetical protein